MNDAGSQAGSGLSVAGRCIQCTTARRCFQLQSTPGRGGWKTAAELCIIEARAQRDAYVFGTNMIGWLASNSLGRLTKRHIQRIADGTIVIVALFAATWLRLDDLTVLVNARLWLVALVTAAVTVIVFGRTGVYQIVVRHIGSSALRIFVIGSMISACVLALAAWALGAFLPRSVAFIYAMLLFLGAGGVRFVVRALVLSNRPGRKRPVLIYGAGASGRQLSRLLREGTEYAPVAFIDDSEVLQGSMISGMMVYRSEKLMELSSVYGAKDVLLAMPSVKGSARANVLRRLETLPLHIRTVPGIDDILSGKANLADLAEVPIEDLLGRDIIPPRADLMDASVKGKVVMVTGAGGSIGSELARQIALLAPARLVLLESSEFALYSVDQEISKLIAQRGCQADLRAVLGSVQKQARLENVMREWKVQTVFHAAAYKHVPLVEGNPVEGVQNNAFGTLATLNAARAAGVERFTLISTDKAVRPTNVMGASKRLAEMICQAAAADGADMCISMVRFGNVLGSSGSVIPAFRQQIKSGGPIEVTHPEVTRYFMTIPEAAQLVIQASAMAKGGDVFLLDMGESVRIADLAARMARLSGLRPRFPGEDDAEDERATIDIVFTQLRPGEKLYEELLIGERSVIAGGHPRIMVAMEAFLPSRELAPLLEKLRTACDDHDEAEIRRILREAPTGYAGSAPP